MQFRSRITLPAFITTALVLSLIGSAQAVSWSSYDRSHSISRHQDFWVLKDNGECVVKQSYANNTSRMELSYKSGGRPTLSTPFFNTPEKVIYEVDPADVVPSRDVSRSELSSGRNIHLPRGIVSEMKRGRDLKVMAKVDGVWSHVQTFSLTGFTAATDVLDGPECR